MSQRGPAPRPASRRSSLSPAKDGASSPASQRSLARQDDSNILPAQELGGYTLTGGEGRRRSRTSGVHDILNPPEPRGALAGPPGSRPAIKEESPPHIGMAPGQGQHGGETPPTHYYTFPPQGATTPQQLANPTIPPPTIPPPPSLLGRGSPSATPSYLAAGRRILTPRSPRAASLSRAASRVVEPQHITNLPPNTPRSAAPPHDVSPLGGSPAAGDAYPIPGPIRGPGGAGPPPARPTSGLSRSLSQPMMGHAMQNPRQDALQPHNLGRGLGSLPSVYPPPAPPFTPPVPSGGGIPGQGLMGEWRWGSGALTSGQAGGGSGPRGFQIAEGHQHLITITPDHGEKIVVPVNTHEGSKQMNEKRQRNAGASARFRHRKKIKDQAMMEEMQKLEAQNRELLQRVKDLEEERDFYLNGGRPGEFQPRPRPPDEQRAERGPSSPVSSRSGGSYKGETSPLPATSTPSAPPAPAAAPHPFPQARSQTQSHPHPPPVPYGDPSSLERPARRRRIDSTPELAALSHSSSPPASLPPIPSPAFGIPPSPLLTGQPGTARLPPLRFDQPVPSSTPTPPPILGGPPPAPQQRRPGGPYPPYSTGPYAETAGWATEPYRGQPENRPK